MSVVDLSKRTTSSWSEYNKTTRSINSLIYIKDGALLDNAGPASMNLTVGSSWYDCSKGKHYKIPAKGLKLKPGKSVLIEAKQDIALPYNVFGVIYGLGTNIFKGGFISTGKINPGYHGVLKIGYHNGSRSVLELRSGDLIACCSFFNVETTMEAPLEKYLKEPEPDLAPDTIRHRLLLWTSENWYNLLSLIVSIIALIVAMK